jgi:hypothetical protein
LFCGDSAFARRVFSQIVVPAQEKLEDPCLALEVGRIVVEKENDPQIVVRVSTVVLRSILHGVLARLLKSKGLQLEEFDLRLKSGAGWAPFVVELEATYPMLFGLTAARVEVTVEWTAYLCNDNSLRLEGLVVRGPGIQGWSRVLASPFIDAVEMVRSQLAPYNSKPFPLLPLFPGLSAKRFTLTCKPDRLTVGAVFEQSDPDDKQCFSDS